MRPTAGDLALPAVLALLGAVELVSLEVANLAASIAVESGACLLLVFRRRATLVTCVLAGVLVIMLPYLGSELNEPTLPILITGLGSFALARHLPPTCSLPGLAVIALALFTAQRVTMDPPPGLTDVLFILVVVASPYAFGWIMRTQTRLLQARQEAERREAVAEERARIARDLHDVLAHSISAMVVQAEVAAELVHHQPERAVAALGQVTSAGREALEETGQVLRRFRDDGGELGLTSRLDRLDVLLARFRQGGLTVDLTVRGDLGGLPADVDEVAFRVAQESLTNALKYAGDRVVSVRLCRTETELTLTTTNRTSKQVRTSGGLGLTGMRERVEAIGGRLSAGPDGDRFEVRAVLPL
ncbi:sensor histidine kinase [Herbidospora sp. RD11066]